MAHFPSTLTRAESDAMVHRIADHFREDGFGLWAVEAPGIAPFLGFVGLAIPRFEAHFTPCVEIGWRIAPDFWGQGYASEAARATLAFAFETLRLPEIVALTVPANTRSIRVMEAIGMRRDPADDFDHPSLPEGHRLRRHILHRLSREAWTKRTNGAAGEGLVG